MNQCSSEPNPDGYLTIISISVSPKTPISEFLELQDFLCDGKTPIPGFLERKKTPIPEFLELTPTDFLYDPNVQTPIPEFLEHPIFLCDTKPPIPKLWNFHHFL
jgi:hypothetical protein